MKLKNIIKNIMIGAMLVSGSYAFINPVDAKAATNNNYELSAKAKNELNEKAKVNNTISKIEEEHPIVEGATVKKYTYVNDNDYVKNGKFYKVYKLYWAKTCKVSYVGIAMHTASSYEQVMYSTNGNHVDSRAKLTSQQKKIITTLTKSKTNSKKFRYVAVYKSSYKATKLYIVPKNGEKAKYTIQEGYAYALDSFAGLNLPVPTKNASLKSTTKIAYNLNVLPHVTSYKNWYKAFVSGGEHYGYSITLETQADKILH